MRHTGSNKSKVTPHNYSYKNNAKLRNVLTNGNTNDKEKTNKENEESAYASTNVENEKLKNDVKRNKAAFFARKEYVIEKKDFKEKDFAKIEGGSGFSAVNLQG